VEPSTDPFLTPPPNLGVTLGWMSVNHSAYSVVTCTLGTHQVLCCLTMECGNAIMANNVKSHYYQKHYAHGISPTMGMSIGGLERLTGSLEYYTRIWHCVELALAGQRDV